MPTTITPNRPPAGASGENDYIPWGDIVVDDPLIVSGGEIGTPAVAGSALSIIFDKCLLDLHGAEGPLTQVRVGTIFVPVVPQVGKALTGVSVSARYSITKTAGSRALLVLDAAGQQRLLEYPYQLETRSNVQMDMFLGTIPVVQIGETRFALNLILCAQRATPADQVSITIDSVDATAFCDPLPTETLQPQPAPMAEAQA
jgi:hypothetical protein